jgi:hypothetical protein
LAGDGDGDRQVKAGEKNMAQVALPVEEERFGATDRNDNWWAGPLATFIGLMIFVIYATVTTFQGEYFEIRKDPAHFSKENNPAVAPYLTPFYSPLLFDGQSEHALFKQAKPAWWPGWFPFSAAILILPFPLLFRMTCYYYRKAYYRSFWADPPGCAVGEPRHSYWGENHWPLLVQNAHRYTLYFALLLIFILTWDVLRAFWWPTLDGAGNPTAGHQFGMGLGTLIMAVNVVLICGFTFGCNSLRHLVGGRLDCFSCPGNVAAVTGGYKAWRCVSYFNERHALWAWLSLFSVGFTDLYIRLCAMGIWKDVRFF